MQEGRDLFARNDRLVARRARLYETVRTAHLERAHELDAAAIVYRYRRYDFDESAAIGLELVQAGPIRTALIVARSSLDILEVNEPLMLASLPTTTLTLFLLAVRRVTGRPRPRIVTYAIANDDPFVARAPRSARTRARRRLERVLANWVWRRIDRIAYGTDAARAVYETVLGTTGPAASRVVDALPAPCEACIGAADPHSVVFLGAFAARKGLPVLLDAWTEVRASDEDARLQLVGKGALEQRAIESARTDQTITVTIDPPRARIHEILGAAQVLVLPSQASPTWREQVGLPIVEALAHGTSIVTTDQTGLAGWLADHGHSVIAAESGAHELAQAIRDQLRRSRSASEVTASLPARDGRLLADTWLFEDAVAVTPAIPASVGVDGLD